MDHWVQQLIILPVLIPLLCGALLIFFSERQHTIKLTLSLLSAASLLAIALTLLRYVDGNHWDDGVGVYLAANWVAPFGIALVVDRLAVLMLLLTAIMGLAVLCFSSARWGRVGVHYYSLFQFLLMGLNGAFLTGDLFNLFVFFEIMLAASYGLLLHGYNATRIRAGMQYIVINLVCSFFFLIGVALIYAATGTLNMADIALRVAELTAEDRQLLETGAAILAVVFLTKCASWPLCFWLPTTYSAASPPVSAMLVLVTKVGIYAVLRLWSLVFTQEAGDNEHFGATYLLWFGLLTIAYGLIGMLASQEPGRMAGYSAIVSSGTLLAAISFGEAGLTGAALFYLVSSTLALGALMLLIELIERIRTPAAAMLAITMEAFAIEDDEEESVGVAMPAAMAFLGLAFIACALIIVGLPPLSGFVAKFGLFHALLTTASAPGSLGWLFLILVVVSGLSGIIALMRFGVRTFWASGATSAPRLRVSEALPVMSLLLVCVAMTVQAGTITDYLQRTAQSLHTPENYIEQVLAQEAVPNAVEVP